MLDWLADAIGAAAAVGAVWLSGILLRSRRARGASPTIMTYENLLVERDGAVAVVTINRPEGAERAERADDRRARAT